MSPRQKVVLRRIALTLGVIGLVIIAGCGFMEYELRKARRNAERDVTRTLDSIRRLGATDALSLHAITNAAVGGASVQILSTSPVVFRVSAMTPWPDLMIYEYDSKTPETGVYHYSF